MCSRGRRGMRLRSQGCLKQVLRAALVLRASRQQTVRCSSQSPDPRRRRRTPTRSEFDGRCTTDRDANGVFKPGPCAKYDAVKMQEQTRCEHPFESLKWGGNDTSMYAACASCGLKTCIMYKKNRAFVTDAEAETSGVHLVELSPGLVMIDTGCRAAVGGRKWHQGLQGRLKELGKKFHCAKQLEFFQFGPGDPIRSTRRWHYQVGVQGVSRELVMS